MRCKLLYAILPYIIFLVTVVVTGAYSPHAAEAPPDANQPRYDHAATRSRQHLPPPTVFALDTSRVHHAPLHFPQCPGSGDSKPAHNRRQAEVPRDSSDLPTPRFIHPTIPRQCFPPSSCYPSPFSFSTCSLNIFFQLPPEFQSDLLPALPGATHSGSVSEDEVAILEKEIPLLQVLLALSFDAARW